MSPDGPRLFVAITSTTVYIVDTQSGQVVGSVEVGFVPNAFAVRPDERRDGKRLYVGNEAGYLNEIHLPTGELAANIPLAGGAFGIGVTPDDREAYVSLAQQGLVQIFNLQTRKLSKALSVGGVPRRIAFSHRGHIGAIANESGFVTFVR